MARDEALDILMKFFSFVGKYPVDQEECQQHVHHHKTIYKIVIENFT
jgi:hypothetical protein